MATLKQTVNETYYWSLDRVYELCSRDDFEEVVNGDALPVSYTHLTLPTTPYV